MTTEDRAKLARMLEACGDLFNRSVSPGMIGLYADALGDWTPEQIGRAIRDYVASPRGKFFPMPADLVEQLRGDSKGAAAIALGTLRRAIRGVGRYQSVVFEGDPAIGQAVEDMGGWVAVCAMEEPGLSIQFERCYSTRHAKGETAGEIVCRGLHSVANLRIGREPEPVRIGHAPARLIALREESAA